MIVECNALPTLIQMLRSADMGIHYEAVGVIGNLVHSSQHIKKTVLQVGGAAPETVAAPAASLRCGSNTAACVRWGPRTRG